MDQFGLVVVTPAEPPNGEYEAHDRDPLGKQLYALYPNGYGASIVQGPYSYGGRQGACSRLQYSTAQTKIGDGDLCYASPITSDVLGYLTEVEVVTLLHQIARLPSNAYCTHARNYDDDEE